MAGPGLIRVVTFDFWQTRLADTPESTAAAHALRLRSVGEALARAGHRYDAAALAVLQAIWALHYVADAALRHFGELPSLLSRLG